MKKGLTHIYTGKGRGKTSAALGLALRALGKAYNVAIIQFMKEKKDNAIKSIEKLENCKTWQYGRKNFVDKEKPDDIDFELAKTALRKTQEIIQKRNYKLVILDEINVALEYGLIKKEEIGKIIDEKPDEIELILTGRYAEKSIIQKADIVTEMKNIKHPNPKKFPAREGFEY